MTHHSMFMVKSMLIGHRGYHSIKVSCWLKIWTNKQHWSKGRICVERAQWSIHVLCLWLTGGGDSSTCTASCVSWAALSTTALLLDPQPIVTYQWSSGDTYIFSGSCASYIFICYLFTINNVVSYVHAVAVVALVPRKLPSHHIWWPLIKYLLFKNISDPFETIIFSIYLIISDDHCNWDMFITSTQLCYGDHINILIISQFQMFTPLLHHNLLTMSWYIYELSNSI